MAICPTEITLSDYGRFLEERNTMTTAPITIKSAMQEKITAGVPVNL